MRFEHLQAELFQLLDETPLGDRGKRGLQTVQVNGRGVTLRAAMTGKDPTVTWNLRFHLRRGLVEFLQANYPGGFVALDLRRRGTP